MARWDEATGRVSGAFARWRLVERDQRAFLRVGLRFAQERYDALWEEAGRRPSAGRGDRRAAFEELVDGLWQDDYEWMLAGGTLQEAIAGYERYAAQAWREAVGGGGWEPGGAAPARWDDLRARFAADLDVRIEPDGVTHVRRLGRLLRERGDELHGEHRRRTLPAGGDPALHVAAALDAVAVIEAMDVLARAVLAADPVVLAHAEGRRQAP